MAVCVLSLAGCGDDEDNPTAADPSAVVPEPAAASGGLREFFGAIDSLTATRLVVDGNTFVVDGETHVFRQGVEVGYGLLGVGNVVVVKARTNTRGEMVAREIKMRVDVVSDMKLTGHVEQIASPDLTVSGRLVHTNSGTAFVGLGDPRSLADLQVGYLVTVTGSEGDDRSILATKIRLEAKK
jgi:hypothetical protein